MPVVPVSDDKALGGARGLDTELDGGRHDTLVVHRIGGVGDNGLERGCAPNTIHYVLEL